MTREINEGERSGKRQEWQTSRVLAARLDHRFGFDLDAMATYAVDPKTLELV